MPERCTLAYPIQIENGSLKLSKGFQIDIDSVFSVLETVPGERILEPSYGLADYLFSSIINTTLISSRVKIALIDQIANVNIETQTTINDSGEIDCKIFIESALNLESNTISIRV